MASKKTPIGFIARVHHLHEEYQALRLGIDRLGTEGRVRIRLLDYEPRVTVPVRELVALLKREQKRIGDELKSLNIDIDAWDPQV